MKRMLLCFSLPTVFLFCSGCDLLQHSLVLRVFSGTISVPDSGYWNYLKLGIFSGGESGDFPQLTYSDNGSAGVTGYRLLYAAANDGSDVSFPQAAGATAVISATGATARTYSFTLPYAFPATSEHLHFVCFYDADLDGMIDLKDSNVPAVIMLGEYNRFPTVAAVNDNEQPTTAPLLYFYVTSPDAGNYKYYSIIEEDSFGSYHGYLDSEHDSGIDFTITANSGW